MLLAAPREKQQLKSSVAPPRFRAAATALGLVCACGAGPQHRDGGNQTAAPISGWVVLVTEGNATGAARGFFGLAADLESMIPCLSDGGSEGCCLVPAREGQAFSSPVIFPTNVAGLSAGALTLTDVTSMTGIGQLTPSGNTSGVGYVGGPLAGWASGDLLEVQASGDRVPAFSKSVEAPPPLAGLGTALMEAADGTLALSVDAGSDFTISWTADSSGDLVEAIAGGASSATLVECIGAQVDGHITFPASLLSGQGGTWGAITVLRTRWSSLPLADIAVGATWELGMDAAFE